MTTIVTRAGKGSALTWTEGDANITNLNTAKLEHVVEDTTPQLGGSLDVNGQSIVSVSNGNIVLEPNGTGDVYLKTDSVYVGDEDADAYIRFNGTTGTNASYLYFTSGGNLSIYPGSAGSLALNTSNNINLNGNGSASNLNLTPGASGKANIKQLNYNEGAIYDLGTTGGTIAPNVTNGNVQKITLNSALTLNAFTTPVAGQSLTLIIYGGTAYTSITSTMKFAGGIKTLTATAGCIDIVSIYYDGTTYFASLGKGFA